VLRTRPDVMPEEGTVAVRHDERIGVIEIRSQPLGVLRWGVKAAILQALRRLESDGDVGAVVLTGTGRAFSVGSDIREFQADPDWMRDADLIEREVNSALETSRLPIICACNGLTLGGGAVLALACDIRYAAESARFAFPEVKVGAVASGGGSQRLPLAVGRGRALELMLTGRFIDAQEALRIGLVEEVVPDESLIPAALELARRIAEMTPMAVAATKSAVAKGLRDGPEEGEALELELAIALGLTADAIEGQHAFLQKRAPSYGAAGRSAQAIDSDADAESEGAPGSDGSSPMPVAPRESPRARQDHRAQRSECHDP
jgi:enoyl-CoA hydratase/carnithine racemase